MNTPYTEYGDEIIPAGIVIALILEGESHPEYALGGILLFAVGDMLAFAGNLLAAVRLAVHIVYQRAVVLELTQLLLIQERHIGNHSLPFQQAVQEVYQQVLVDLLPKDFFESDISKRIDKSAHSKDLMLNNHGIGAGQHLCPFLSVGKDTALF